MLRGSPKIVDHFWTSKATGQKGYLSLSYMKQDFKSTNMCDSSVRRTSYILELTT